MQQAYVFGTQLDLGMDGYDPQYWETRKIRQELQKMNRDNQDRDS